LIEFASASPHLGGPGLPAMPGVPTLRNARPSALARLVSSGEQRDRPIPPGRACAEAEPRARLPGVPASSLHSLENDRRERNNAVGLLLSRTRLATWATAIGLLRSRCVFEKAFFGRTFADRVRKFSGEHDDAKVRLEVVTLSGERLDALELSAVDTGATLSTRDNRLLFLPYAQIAYVEVAILHDHRVAGFQLSVGSE
jgi:hypothetical protein